MYGQEQTGTTMPIRAASVFSNFACDEHGGSFLLEMPDDVGSQGERLGLSPIVFIVASESWFGLAFCRAETDAPGEMSNASRPKGLNALV